jgi:hypothetical protein
MRGQNRTILRTLASGLALIVAVGTGAMSPVVANDADQLSERSDTTYRLLPDEGVVRVASTVHLTNKTKPITSRGPCKKGRGTCTIKTRFYFTTWHSFWAPPGAVGVTVGGPKVKALPPEEVGGGLAYAATYPKLWNKKGAKQTVTIAFDLPAGTIETTDHPTRIEDGYAFFCWWGMVGDTGTTRAILPPGWDPVLHDDSVAVAHGAEGVVLSTKSKQDPEDFIDCVEVIEPERLQRTYAIGEAGKSLVVVEAWPGDEAWASSMTEVAIEALPNLEAMLGTPMPYGELRVRETATQARGDVFGDLRPTDGVLGMTEVAGAPTLVANRLARAWLDPEQITEPWLVEGLASWLAARAVTDLTCSEPGDYPGPDARDLDDWVVAESSEALPLATWQWSTACQLVELGAEIIGDEAMIDLIRELINAPVPVGTSHWLAGISRGLPDGLDTLVAALDAAGVDH